MSQWRKVCALTGAVVASLLALTACGGSGSAPKVSHQGTVDHIQVAVSEYGIGVFGLPYLVAEREGMFKRNDIAVDKIVGGSGGGTTVRLLLAGRLAFAEAALPAVVEAVGQSTPLQIVGGGARDVNEACVITRKDAPFDSVKSLVGHTLSFTNPGSGSEAYVRLMVANAGFKQSQFSFKATGGVPEGVALLAKGAVDETTGFGPLCEPNAKFKQVVPAGKAVPAFQENVTVTSKQFAAQHPQLVRRFLAALAQANDWIRQNPDQAGALLASTSRQPQAPTVALLRTLTNPMHWDVGLSADALNATLEGATLAGVFKPGATIPWGTILNQAYLPAGAAHVDPGQLSIPKQVAR